MARTWVQIKRFAVKDISDPKHRSRLPALMRKAVEKAIRGSSKLTLDAPREKGATGLSLDGSLESPAPDAAAIVDAAVASAMKSGFPYMEKNAG